MLYDTTYIPRVDTHRHFGGSLPTAFVWDVIQQYGWRHLAETQQDVLAAMTFLPGEQHGFHRFLSKFEILDRIPWTRELIAQSVAAVADELELDRIDYCWMDASVNKYMDAGINWHRWEAIKYLHDCFEEYAPDKVGLVLSIKYESTRASQRQLAALVDNQAVCDSVIGLDLVGDESMFDGGFYAPILQHWRQAGKFVRAHVGEYGTWTNVSQVIQAGVTNIAHGLAIIENREGIQQAIDSDISFDLGLTSNLLTGVATVFDHPLRAMLDAGLRITLGTDDPVVCNTDLDREYQLCAALGASRAEIAQIRRNSALLMPAAVNS